MVLPRTGITTTTTPMNTRRKGRSLRMRLTAISGRPENAINCVRREEVLCREYPENQSLYQKNAEGYVSKLEELDRDFADMTSNAPNDVIVIGDRFPFRYLAHEYGLEYFAAFSGRSSESEPSVRTMACLMDEVAYCP